MENSKLPSFLQMWVNNTDLQFDDKGGLKLFTVVPISRLMSIGKYGLLTNDKVSNMECFNKDEEMRGRVFDISKWGSIYATTSLKKAMEWIPSITLQMNEETVILEYFVNKEIIKTDFFSPDRSLFDVLFNIDIAPSEITVLNGDLSIDKDNNYIAQNISRIPLLELCEKAKSKCAGCNNHSKYKDMLYSKSSGEHFCPSCVEKLKEVALKKGGQELLDKIALDRNW